MKNGMHKIIPSRKTLMEYLKYNIVGSINFIVCQIIYVILLFKFKINYVIAYTICNFISACFSYIVNSKVTFEESKYSIKNFIKVYCSHLFEYFLNLAIVTTLIEILHISKILAPMITPVITTPLIFILVKKSIKKES